VLTPEAITRYLQRLSAFATVEVAGQTQVAGRDAYQLRFTPAAEDTALGYVQAAVDGETMLPLQLEIYAKGGSTPVIKFGFTSVSYDAIDASTFTFTPPEGATVTTKAVDADKLRAELEEAAKSHEGVEPTAKLRAEAVQAVQGALLTREQVAKLVPYDLAYARDYGARAYRWGAVLDQGGPLTSHGISLGPLLASTLGMDSEAAGGTFDSHERISVFAIQDVTSVLLYGDGFGTIVLAQTSTTPELEKQLAEARKTSQILGKTTVGGAEALKIGTPLGGVIVWQLGDTTLLAGGMVPMSDLEAFARSVR
jgi:hypothetical protein